MQAEDKTSATSEVTSLWDDYQNGLAYQANSGLSKNIPKFVKFYEGDQWAPPTKNTKNLPRPVVNIIKMICRNKKSAILSTPVKITYSAEDSTVNVDKFNKFAEYIQKEMGMKILDKKAIDDAVKKGSYFYHYYWDSEAKGKDGTREGGLRCEVIDVLNIFFADPTQLDEQKQEWILIASRENVRSVRAKCDKDVDPDSIRADESENKYGTVEQEGDELCTVLTKYFRKRGEVYCEIATKSVIVRKAFPITPDLQSARSELGYVEEDAPNNDIPDKSAGKNLMPDSVKAYLYPIVVGNYEIREKSIYGLGEVEGLIPNQKAINFNIAMSLLNNQEMAWGKYVVLPGALKGQTITNEPGQVLTDHSNTGNGIRKLTEQSIHSQPMQLVDTLTQLTRGVTGSTEVMTGETLGTGMSGAAIAQLQSQALQPVEELKETFWLVKEKQGKVLAQFFKLYYAEKEFFYTEELTVDENGIPIENPELANVPLHTEDVQLTDVFNGAEYRNTEFAVTVEATAGTKASAAGDINALDVLLQKGAISIRTYIKAYPEDALSNKSELLKGIEAEEQNQIKELTARLEQAEAEKQQLTQLVEQQKATVEKVVSIVEENTRLRTFIANMYTEAKMKINSANAQIKAGNAKIAETTQDASDFAQYIYSGMPGTNQNLQEGTQIPR